MRRDNIKIIKDFHKELADMKIMLRQAEMIFSKKKINKYVNQKLASKQKKYLTND